MHVFGVLIGEDVSPHQEVASRMSLDNSGRVVKTEWRTRILHDGQATGYRLSRGGPDCLTVMP